MKRGSYLRRIKAEYFVHLLKCRIMPEVSRYGDIPRRALTLIFEWIDLHKDELIENWKRIEERKPLKERDTFARFTLNDFTIEWPNGADFAPEYLYEIGK